MAAKRANCYIIAGSNGAGKTIATEFLPHYDVRRRFGRTLGNLFRLYRPLLDTLYFFDDSADTPRLVFKDEAGSPFPMGFPWGQIYIIDNCGREDGVCPEEFKLGIDSSAGMQTA